LFGLRKRDGDGDMSCIEEMEMMHRNKKRSKGDGDVGFCSACVEEMEMLRINKKRSQGDGDVGG
jgi:hypothetical protein